MINPEDPGEVMSQGEQASQPIDAAADQEIDRLFQEKTIERHTYDLLKSLVRWSQKQDKDLFTNRRAVDSLVKKLDDHGRLPELLTESNDAVRTVAERVQRDKEYAQNSSTQVKPS